MLLLFVCLILTTAQNCVHNNGYYCFNDMPGTVGSFNVVNNALYQCQNNTMTYIKTCSNGCRIIPNSGYSDFCSTSVRAIDDCIAQWVVSNVVQGSYISIISQPIPCVQLYISTTTVCAQTAILSVNGLPPNPACYSPSPYNFYGNCPTNNFMSWFWPNTLQTQANSVVLGDVLLTPSFNINVDIVFYGFDSITSKLFSKALALYLGTGNNLTTAHYVSILNTNHVQLMSCFPQKINFYYYLILPGVNTGSSLENVFTSISSTVSITSSNIPTTDPLIFMCAIVGSLVGLIPDVGAAASAVISMACSL